MHDAISAGLLHIHTHIPARSGWLRPRPRRPPATAFARCALLLTGWTRNYAKSHPDLCILAVNTFVQDSEDPNPLIRALAIRTMGCIRVDKMVDYMEEPLRKTLRDESPY